MSCGRRLVRVAHQALLCITGIAVIIDMTLTTHFMTLLMITVWRKWLGLPLLFYVVFASIELTYVSSALRKVRLSTRQVASVCQFVQTMLHCTCA